MSDRRVCTCSGVELRFTSPIVSQSWQSADKTWRIETEDGGVFSFKDEREYPDLNVLPELRSPQFDNPQFKVGDHVQTTRDYVSPFVGGMLNFVKDESIGFDSAFDWGAKGHRGVVTKLYDPLYGPCYIVQWDDDAYQSVIIPFEYGDALELVPVNPPGSDGGA